MENSNKDFLKKINENNETTNNLKDINNKYEECLKKRKKTS